MACRRAEIGIRMAVGADRGDILRLILREAGSLLGVGLAAGLLLTLLTGHVAARAARLDPTTALRE